MAQVKIGVLISGSGTNLQAIIDNIDSGNINGKITVVISNRKDAYGLKRAENNGIDAVCINRRDFENEDLYNNEIIRILKDKNVELVVLAGYLRILNEKFVNEYKNRIINIHPSLIPSFCGKGFYGEKVHEAVLEYGVRVTGATVHFVDCGTDTGPIILQEVVKVDEDDTVDTLKKKVLKVEHKILPDAVKLFSEGRLKIVGRKVIIDTI